MTTRTTPILAAVAALLLLLPAGVAGAQAPDDSVAAAAGFLASQLVDGTYAETEFDGDRFPDPGLTADVVLALSAAGRGGDAIARAVDWLEDQTAMYVGDGDEAYAGAHAKLALTVDVAGRDATDFGGRDLLADLQSLETEEGRFSDRSEFGDFSTGISQSLALLALERAGDGPSDAAVSFLADAACDDGGIPVQFDADTCTSDVDATAFAAQAFLAVGAGDAADAALAWLLDRQADDGSFGANGDDAVANANSTGLAAQALQAAGEGTAADAAVAWLEGLQQTCDDDVEVAGAIRYAPDTDGDLVRATAQALPALAGVDLLEVDAAGAQADAPPVVCDEAVEADDDPAEAEEEAAPPADEAEDVLAEEPATDAAGRGLPFWFLLALIALFLVGVGVALARKRSTEKPA